MEDDGEDRREITKYLVMVMFEVYLLAILLKLVYLKGEIKERRTVL